MATASPQELRAMLPAFLSEIDRAETIVLGSHVNPDGDSLGSLIALSLVLDSLGKKHTVLTHHDPPKNLLFLPHINKLTKITQDLKPDLAIVLDLENLERLGSTLQETFSSAKRMMVIDHHIPVDEPGDVRIVSTKSPATAAILADLFRESNISLDQDVATCLLTGIITDTGSFRFPNTTSHSMHVAAELLEAGADLGKIIEEVYMRKTKPAVKLQGKAISGLQLASNDKLGWTILPYKTFEECDATDEDTEGLVNEILAIETVEIALILREAKKGKIRGSIRSRGNHDVAAAAREFGGGGHKNAAGVSFDGSIKEAEKNIVEALKKCLE